MDTSEAAWSDEHRASLIWGTYESAEVRLVEGELRPDVPVVELGSSLGVLASHITSRLNSDVSYIGVEVDPALME